MNEWMMMLHLILVVLACLSNGDLVFVGILCSEFSREDGWNWQKWPNGDWQGKWGRMAAEIERIKY
jgi:hypothetical protein